MILQNAYRKAFFARQFELKVASLIKEKKTYIPIYLSIGQEHIPAIVSEHFPDSYIFAQHRCHSWYLAYGGDPTILLQEILGGATGMKGSASVDIKGKMFGHSGLLGDQIPIAVGFADAKKKHTICVGGDAAFEEDYALGAMGHAVTKNAPILFLVEDNNLSILTEKKVRRSWDIVKVARGFGIYATNITDEPSDINNNLVGTTTPYLININTTRHYWHQGAGQDFISEVDRLKDLAKIVEEFYEADIVQIEEEETAKLDEICKTLQV